MRRFWLDSKLDEGQAEVMLEGDILHHVRDVCRMAPGAKFEVLTEDRKAYFVELVEVSRKTGRLRILEERLVPEIPGPPLTLYLSLPKFATFENVLEKSVELGVHKVQPFFSQYSFVKNASKLSPSRIQRWQKIVRSATQQSGRGDLMTVEAAKSLAEILEEFGEQKGVRGLFAYEGDSHRGIREELKSWESGEEISEVAVFVGSEGGFSEAEVEVFRKSGLAPVSLGQQILRVETACVTLVGIVKYHTGALE